MADRQIAKSLPDGVILLGVTPPDPDRTCSEASPRGGKVCWKVELRGTAHIDHIGLCMLQLFSSVQMPWSSLMDIIEPDRIRSQNLEIGDRGPERTL